MITEIIIQTCSRWWRRQQGEEKTARLMALSRYLKQTPEMEMLTPRSAGGGGVSTPRSQFMKRRGWDHILHPLRRRPVRYITRSQYALLPGYKKLVFGGGGDGVTPPPKWRRSDPDPRDELRKEAAREPVLMG